MSPASADQISAAKTADVAKLLPLLLRHLSAVAAAYHTVEPSFRPSHRVRRSMLRIAMIIVARGVAGCWKGHDFASHTNSAIL